MWEPLKWAPKAKLRFCSSECIFWAQINGECFSPFTIKKPYKITLPNILCWNNAYPFKLLLILLKLLICTVYKRIISSRMHYNLQNKKWSYAKRSKSCKEHKSFTISEICYNPIMWFPVPLTKTFIAWFIHKMHFPCFL